MKAFCGNYSFMFINETGDMWSLGSNKWSHIGLDTLDKCDNIIKCNDFPIVKYISSCFETTFIIDENGSPWGFGRNCKGQLGYKGLFSENIPKCLSNFKNIKKISVGCSFTLLLDNKGFVWSFGNNVKYSLGLGDNKDRNTPCKVNLKNIKDISTGELHCHALSEAGEVYSWGMNHGGQTGLGHCELVVKEPTKIPNLSFIKCLYSSFGSSTIIQDENMILWGMGSNGYGELGYDGGQAHSPRKLTFPENEIILDVACGYAHTVVLTSNNVWVCGNNEYNQIGLSDTIVCEFTILPLSEDIHFISAGHISIALCGTNNIWLFGRMNEEDLKSDINKKIIPIETFK